MEIRVGILEDDEQIREAVSLLINGSHGFSCIDKFHTAEYALKLMPSLNLDVALIDIQLPGMSGIDCISKLKPLCPNTQFIIFTSFEDNESIFNALKAGAVGYLVKTTEPYKILEAITEVKNGGSPMSGAIARKIISSFNVPEVNKHLELLSEREQEIISLLSKGYRYKEIADLLFISTETTRTHIRNIYRKLQVNSSIDAINKVYPK